ncbi:dickkopf-related protein 3 [Bombina bombina]|uniref:dickkopf-related protein 3 n=1 Tax=Bombina bombina TaxID=8345 RepID=UPI00235AAD4D|nr:dickkopf-related protein 3 [Bombina bombina]
MARLTLFLLMFILGFVVPSPTKRPPGSKDDVPETANSSLLDPVYSFTEDEASLNEMFREVEELMEDTQSKLQNAVKEMEAEEVSDQRVPENLPPNYHNESFTKTNIGNKTVETKQEIVKETDNKTGSTLYSETLITSIKSRGNKVHECIVDEDCKSGNYCHFGNAEYKCLPCKTKEACTRDGECCADQLCVWGTCTKASRGDNGTICESQQECNPGFCCSVQPSLLFPVCSPLAIKGELCHDPSAQLLDLISWELEPDGVLDNCPCSNGLVCNPQSHSSVSVCEEPSIMEARRDNGEILVDDLPFISLVPQEELMYEEGNTMPTAYGMEPDPSEDIYGEEPEIIPDLPFDI